MRDGTAVLAVYIGLVIAGGIIILAVIGVLTDG